jgi:hypothetical protein
MPPYIRPDDTENRTRSPVEKPCDVPVCRACIRYAIGVPVIVPEIKLMPTPAIALANVVATRMRLGAVTMA